MYKQIIAKTKKFVAKPKKVTLRFSTKTTLKIHQQRLCNKHIKDTESKS